MNDDIVKKVGLRIRQVRGDRRMTQAGLAERAGLAPHTVSRIERGEQAPSLVALNGIAGAFDMSLAALLDFEGTRREEDAVEALMTRLPADQRELRAQVRLALEALTGGK